MALRSLAIIFLFLCTILFAEEEQGSDGGEIIVLPSNAVVDNDYFANGRTVEISGTVNGDVYVLGGQIFIDGIVNGDVLVAGGSVEISGKVTKNIRLIAGQALISGQVGGNITSVTGTIELSPSSSIGRNAVIVSGNTDLESKVGNNVRLYASSVRISDGIQGKVIAYVGHLRLTSKANIGGSLEYWSNKNALVDPNAKIKEGIIHHPSFFYDFFHSKLLKGLKIGSKLAALLMNFFYSFIIGLVMLRYFPRRVERTIETLNSKPAQSLVAGIVLLFLLPVTMLVLLITILGAPFALALLSLTVIGLYTAKVFSVLWLSTNIFRKLEFKKHRRLYFSFGLIVYFILTTIPYLGTIVTIAALLFGIGGAALGRMDNETKNHNFLGLWGKG
ncbi:MAG: polymer-forming cytoskeletal protein [Simkaniaceae bacterium]|jgi:hypothetical protein|nr:MAG: polymer-forming cytoskeletal protein [Simkaniaceae bacterium]